MKTIFQATVLNPYRSKKPKGFYHAIKGHTGIDLKYVHESLPSPVTGKVVGLHYGKEMGNVMYIEDSQDCIHIFAHLSEYKKKMHDEVKRGELIAITGNSGSKTTAPHLHYEIITPQFKLLTYPDRPQIDRIMTRQLYGFKGLNVDPITYVKRLYQHHSIPIV